MERFTHRDPLPAGLDGAIFALGNFDGFHLGHQAVVGLARDWARDEGRPLVVATFEPHPIALFKPGAPPFRLTTLDQRAELFAAAGADAMLVFAFDRALAALTPREFVVDVMRGHLGAKGVVTGADFTFGRGAKGTPDDFTALGLPARVADAVCDSGGPVSSTRVRDALRGGDCAEAAQLLTRPHAIRGRVQHGDKRGRTIGYPTANVALGDYLRPAYGIYAVTARLADGRVVKGAANLGIRPTFDPPVELLEVFLFDFAGDLYGQEIEVALHARLRPEAKFDSLEALTRQMDADCDAAREVLSALAT